MSKKFLVPFLVVLGSSYLAAMEKSAEKDMALIDAIRSGDQITALQLIRQGANADAQTTRGETVLMGAAYEGQVEVVKALIAARASINNQAGCVFPALVLAAENGHAEVVKILIISGAHIDVQDKDGYTALTYGAQNGNMTLVKLLLDNGAAVDLQGPYGTALMYAAIHSHTEIVKMLIAAGASLNPQSKYNKTILSCVSNEIAKVLIAAGAQFDITLRSYDEYEAFRIRIQKLFECARSLSIECNDASMRAKLINERLHMLNMLIATDVPALGYIDPTGNTLLHYAVKSGNRVAISLVLHLMIKYNKLYALEHRDKQLGMSPIEMALAKGGGKLLHPFFNGAPSNFNLRLPAKS